jgi:hypothetical protein
MDMKINEEALRAQSLGIAEANKKVPRDWGGVAEKWRMRMIINIYKICGKDELEGGSVSENEWKCSERSEKTRSGVIWQSEMPFFKITPAPSCFSNKKT